MLFLAAYARRAPSVRLALLLSLGLLFFYPVIRTTAHRPPPTAGRTVLPCLPSTSPLVPLRTTFFGLCLSRDAIHSSVPSLSALPFLLPSLSILRCFIAPALFTFFLLFSQTFFVLLSLFPHRSFPFCPPVFFFPRALLLPLFCLPDQPVNAPHKRVVLCRPTPKRSQEKPTQSRANANPQDELKTPPQAPPNHTSHPRVARAPLSAAREGSVAFSGPPAPRHFFRLFARLPGLPLSLPTPPFPAQLAPFFSSRHSTLRFASGFSFSFLLLLFLPPPPSSLFPLFFLFAPCVDSCLLDSGDRQRRVRRRHSTTCSASFSDSASSIHGIPSSFLLASRASHGAC